MRARSVLEAAALLGALLFVVGMAYLPHADSARQAPAEGWPAIARLGIVYLNLGLGVAEDYPYTVHVDENMHWSRMASIERAESLRAEGIYDTVPESGETLQLRGLVHERGFFVALVHLHQLTGVEWISIFRFLPALWAGVTAFIVWAALRPWGGAPVAAALVGLVPTSARFLGPGFLVPIGFGLAWVAAAFVLLPHVRRVRGVSGLLVVLTIWAFFIHLIAGFAILLLLLVSIPLQGRNFRSFALLTLTAALPLVVLMDVFAEGVRFEIDRISTFAVDLTVFDQLGLPFLAAWAFGCGVVLTRRPDARLAVLLRAATLASILALGFIVIALVTRGQQYALYDRWHQPFALFATLPAAAGLVSIGERALRAFATAWPRTPAPRGSFAAIVLLAFVASASAGVAGHLHEPYYHVIDDKDWARFTWAAENVNETYDRFLADPWKAPVFHALTGKTPHTWLAPGSAPRRGEDWPAAPTQPATWFVERDIPLVFADRVSAPEFRQASPGVWVLEREYAEELSRLRAR